MKKLLFTLFAALAVTTGANAAEASYQVVPLPQSIRLLKGAPFVLNESRSIVYQGGEEMAKNARFLADYVKEMTKMSLAVKAGSAKQGKGNVFLTLDKKVSGDEGYRISVSKHGVVIAGKTPAGVFYGVQTLRKSLPIAREKAAEVTLPLALITDAPRFAYRGMHLDCARHFFPIKFVKEYIDLMAMHNMNRFHWHITEDQGWRLEIKKYPKLTEVGAWRSGTVVGRNSDVFDTIRYGGFYTQKEVQEIVQYAADRHITIIPEIDLPGHMLAALAAYPELGCTGGPYEVEKTWGVFPDILCGGNPQVYTFIKDVLAEVCTLFPAEYIHIGGDEAPKTRWENCPKCQEMIKKQGIVAANGQSKEDRLQGYFTTEIQKFLASKGKKIIGWDELLECDVDTTAAIMSWRGAEPGAKAAKLGHQVIMSPNSYLYLDYYQTMKDEQWTEPLLIGGELPIEKTYSFEPCPEGDPVAAQKIMGVQGNLWSEYLTSPQLAQYQVLPRMDAIAEVQWMQPQNKDYKSFLLRVNHMRDYYQMMGFTYAKHLWKAKH